MRYIMKDELITCIQCGIQFEFKINEQLHYETMGFDDPKRCSDCRKRKTRQTGDRNEGSSLYRKTYHHNKNMQREELRNERFI